jgi:hypothetical protein
MGIYGPRTVFCLAIKGYPGCHEFLLMDDGKWMHVKETTEIGKRWCGSAHGVELLFRKRCGITSSVNGLQGM